MQARTLKRSAHGREPKCYNAATIALKRDNGLWLRRDFLTERLNVFQDKLTLNRHKGGVRISKWRDSDCRRLRSTYTRDGARGSGQKINHRSYLFQPVEKIFNLTFANVAWVAFGRRTAGSAICARCSASLAASG
jgi:hypothetical protein